MQYQNKKDPKYTKNARRLSSRAVALIVVAAIVVAGGIAAYAYHSHQQRQAEIGSKVIPATADTNSSDSKDQSSTTSPGNTDKNGPAESPATPSSNQTLSQAPSGTFVSNHYPSISGKPTPSAMQSTCNTDPGASCYIAFTNKSGQTKTLQKQTAGANGVVIWNWDVKTAGFTPGEWAITATATLNSSSKSTTDSLKMEVNP